MVAPVPAKSRWAGWVPHACVVVVWLAIAAEVATSAEWLDNPWWAIALQLLSSAAIGVDAIATGVRKREGVGISIKNLAPGGWALFASQLWILAVPAYFFGARRRARRGELEGVAVEPMRIGSWIAIGVLTLLGTLTLLGGLVASAAGGEP
jgi:hypothetical protein